MPNPARNFLTGAQLHARVAAPGVVRGPQPFFALRSLLPTRADAIPRRFSSSSLPPSFVSGRFAGLCLPAHRATTVTGV